MKLFTREILNTVQTAAILILLLLISYIIGYFIFDSYIILILAAAVFAIALLIPKITPDIILRVYGAVKIDHDEAPLLYDALEILSNRAKLEYMPKLYYIPDSSIITFSSGTKDNSAIAISEGMFKILDSDEIYAVMAHEISHISNNDILVMQVADIISRISNFLIYIGFLFLIVTIALYAIEGVILLPKPEIILLLLVPLINLILQLLLSRNREYAADLDAANLTKNPMALVRALKKINSLEKYWAERLVPWDKDREEPSFLRTHPRAKERIERLEEIDRLMREKSGDLFEDTRPRFTNSYKLKKPRKRYSWFYF